MTEDQKYDIILTSGYGARKRQPFVTMVIKKLDVLIQFSPEEARALAQNLVHCAEASEGDAFLFEFFDKELDQGEQAGARVMDYFRSWKERRLENKGREEIVR